VPSEERTFETAGDARSAGLELAGDGGSTRLVTATRLAWGLAALALALLMAGYVTAIAIDASALATLDLLVTAIAVPFAIVGALVAARHPRNPIGRIFLGVALSFGLYGVAEALQAHGLQAGADPGVLVGAAAVYDELIWLSFVIVPLTFVLLLFPDGRLLSRRWRPIAWCAGVGIAGVFISSSLAPDLLPASESARNPFATDSPLVGPLTGVSILLMYVGIFGAVASIVVRFRRAGRVQRQQIKWLAAAGALLAVIAPLDVALESVLAGAAFAATALAAMGLPAAVGVAILRYRLYDIDVVINRTLVYGTLTATLAGAYLGSVLVLQLALSAITEGSGLAVAASTLGVAALFRPARARIQGVVDRRFYRRKYDAQRTLEALSVRLREEIDLDSLSAELRRLVTETMQPAHVSLWLRPRRDGPDAHLRAHGGDRAACRRSLRLRDRAGELPEVAAEHPRAAPAPPGAPAAGQRGHRGAPAAWT